LLADLTSNRWSVKSGWKFDESPKAELKARRSRDGFPMSAQSS